MVERWISDNIISMSIKCNESIQKTNCYPLSTAHNISEFKTVRFNIGRQFGYTTYIKKHYRRNDLIVVDNHQRKRMFEDNFTNHEEFLLRVLTFDEVCYGKASIKFKGFNHGLPETIWCDSIFEKNNGDFFNEVSRIYRDKHDVLKNVVFLG
jgi:hypothetical protein